MNWRPHPLGAVALVIALILGVSAAADASADLVDRQRIFEQLAGRSAGQPATRGIVPEEAAPSAFATATLPAIRFEHDSANLTPQAERQLGELGAALGMAPLDAARFAIQGHTDSTGAAAYNRALSLRRARAAKRHLAAAGIAAGRLTEVGLGEDLPLRGILADDPRNRRVEIVRLGAWRLPHEADAAAPDDRALLIGIDSYPNVSSLLGAPVTDVEEFRGHVVDRLGYRASEVKTLVNGEATREGMLSALHWVLGSTGRALVYFSGHGFRERDGSNDEADGWDETLVPYDVLVEDGVAKGMITDDEIGGLVDGWSGRALDVVIDACHSGTVTRSAGVDWRLIKSPRLPDGSALARATRGFEAFAGADAETFVEAENSNVTVWTAVRADQKALVDATTAPRYASVFTRRLLAGAAGVADADADGAVTARELRDYVVRESAVYCQRHAGDCSTGLSPELSISASAMDKLAFAGQMSRLAPVASVAKDILVAPSMSADGDPGGIRLSIRPSARLRVGDEIEVAVESDVGGALVLLDIDAQGRVTQIFPNERSLADGVPNIVQKGKAVRLPGVGSGFRFRAREPFGEGLLVAVVAPDPTGLANLTSRHKDLSVISRPEAYVVELAGHLRRWSDGHWSYGDLAYEVAAE